METKELFAAMAKAFPDIEGASKDKENPHFRSRYADLGAVVDAIKPALSKHGLWFRQMTHEVENGVCVETFICHSSGAEISCGRLTVPATKNDAQGYGSALTYCRRYSLQTAFGVAPEDDDGNAATKSAPKQAPKPAPKSDKDTRLEFLAKDDLGFGAKLAAQDPKEWIEKFIDLVEVAPDVMITAKLQADNLDRLDTIAVNNPSLYQRVSDAIGKRNGFLSQEPMFQ